VTSSSRRIRRALASSDRSIDLEPEDPASHGVTLGTRLTRRAGPSLGAWRSDGAARWLFIWPTVLVILFLSIFPLVASLTLAFSRLVFAKGRVDIDFVGFTNFQILLFGTERSHLIGVVKTPTPIGWAILTVGVALTAWVFLRSVRSGRIRRLGLLLRLVGGLLFLGLLWIVVGTLAAEGGRPGALIVTLIYVFAGIAIQYALGLGLALLAVQPLWGRRFFRIVFLLPLTITPIGVGYMFRMMTDTGKGPLEPIWAAFGLSQFTWVTDPWLARIAVLIGDAWQWTPFVFIVLLAALEGLDQEVREAALVDGASRFRSFIHITLPAILPVSTTIVLIRLIEGFKIIDMPNILTGGGPGTATQSLSLEAYLDWRTLNLGRSAAIAYLLLIVVTIIATAYVSLVRRRVAGATT
jgi:multiple sugar transport system permease protein